MHEKLVKILDDIRDGKTITHIDLGGCGLDTFPPELFAVKETVESINMGGNNLCDLPLEFLLFSKLKVLFFAGNKFKQVPLVLGALPSLYMLSFKSNQLEEVADESLSPSIAWLILTDNRIRCKSAVYHCWSWLTFLFDVLKSIFTV